MAFATIPLKSTACWFVKNVACLPRTTNLFICHTSNLGEQQNLESLGSISIRIFFLPRFEMRNRFAIRNEQNPEEDMVEISCRGAVAVWELPAAPLSPSQTHPVPEVPEAIFVVLPVWRT